MLLFYVAILILLLFGLKYKQNGIHMDYIQRRQTDTIKGLFILMVFVGHCIVEIRNSGYGFISTIDRLGTRVHSEFGQLIVVMFLFYSGFGVMESIKTKGKEYIKQFPKHRLLTTLLNFDIAVAFFLLLNLALGKKMGFYRIGLSLIGWESLGNSNWYIFVILFCYLITWMGTKVYPNNSIKAFSFIAFFVLCGEIALSYLKHGQPWWYNTMLCYPLGMAYCIHKKQILFISEKYYSLILCFLLIGFLFFHFQHFIPALHGLSYNAKSIMFALLIVHLTMKFRVECRFLQWAGVYLFPIYIYQRLPMIGIKSLLGTEWIITHPYFFTSICAVVTFCISSLYKYWQIRLPHKEMEYKLSI